jgi:hemolysin activation/secretion protein
MRVVILCAAGLFLPATTIAQNVGQGPNYQNPAAPNYQPPVVPPQPAPPAYHLPPLPPEAPGAPPAGGGGQMFVKRIEVRGVTVFQPAQIAAIVAPYENRTVSGAQLQSLRVALTRLYVDKGYINSGVVLPDQKSADGVVIFQAIEGKLTRVTVRGKAHLSRRYVESRVRAHVKEPLNVSELQYALRYLQQDPNVQRLDATLGPGDTAGEAVLGVNVEEQPRFSAGVGVDNYQSSSIGATIGTVNLGARDLTGYGDDLRGSFGHSQGDNIGSAIWTMPVSAHNAFVQLFYSKANAVIIQQPFESLNIKEAIRNYGVTLTVPVVDRLDHRLSLFFGGQSDRSFTELLGIPFSFSPGAQNGVSEATVLLGGVDWLHHGASSVTDLRLTYRRGVDALGATIYTPQSNTAFNPNPTGADGRFGLEQLQFINIVRLNGFSAFAHANDRAQFIIRASGQLTQNPLLSMEKFTVGGVETVRGYPENLLVRDNGYGATLELQLPLPGYRATPYPGNLVFAPFIDYGRSWDKVNIVQGNPLVNTSVANYIAGAGMGLLWNPLRGLDAQVYWGGRIANNFGSDNPLHFAPHDLQYHGVFYAVTYTYRW